MGNYLPGSGTLGWLAWCGAGTPHSWDILPEFLSTTCACETILFPVTAPPTSLDVCGFFNSVVVGLSFSLISDGSKWWLFYILVVILMWLCEEASCVYFRLHLDRKWAPPAVGAFTRNHIVSDLSTPCSHFKNCGKGISSQDGGVGKHTSSPHTTTSKWQLKYRTTIT